MAKLIELHVQPITENVLSSYSDVPIMKGLRSAREYVVDNYKDKLNRFAVVDDEDYERVNQFRWGVHRNGKKLYAVRSVDIKSLHRFILGVEDPNILVDHIDGNGLNNQKRNLRKATKAQNSTNKILEKGNKTGYIGVTLRGNKFIASVTSDKKTYTFGGFESPRKAAEARDKAAIALQGDFAVLNFPEVTHPSYSRKVTRNQMTIKEICEMTNYSEAHVKRLCESNDVKAKKLGKIWLVELDSMLDWIITKSRNAKTLAK